MIFNVSFIGLLLLLTAVVWLWSRRLAQRAGLPPGEVIYSDDGAWFINDQPLYAEDLQLVGKPDYLVEQANGAIIPVELKSRKAPTKPYEGHVLQLAAYCLLVEANFGVRPDYGILQYRDVAFAIDYTEEMEEDLLSLLAEMREDMFATDVDRDHNDWRRCARCGVQDVCYQRLA
ncbi:MAG: PD-(D/E)XK nuclease family protein [Anaerolineales bacterium]|nr:PD-(D/E)XK nuclease family protein [Anaerolineales bacterium]MCB8991744.1 PD-(D/E)XK nuclease family protein [Ardenticatenaceae bacterium]